MTVAERSPEVVSPVPIMRQVVREESRPQGPMRIYGKLKLVDLARGVVEIVDGRIEQGSGRRSTRPSIG
jgi:hypothetical protein